MIKITVKIENTATGEMLLEKYPRVYSGVEGVQDTLDSINRLWRKKRAELRIREMREGILTVA